MIQNLSFKTLIRLLILNCKFKHLSIATNENHEKSCVILFLFQDALFENNTYYVK